MRRGEAIISGENVEGGEKGFTLVEVLMSALLLAIITVSVLAGFRLAYFRTKSLTHRARAHDLVMEGIEGLKARGFNTIKDADMDCRDPLAPVCDNPHQYPPGEPADPDTGEPLHYAADTVTVDYGADGAPGGGDDLSGTRSIQVGLDPEGYLWGAVTVEWNEPPGQDLHEVMTSIIGH